MPLNTMSTVRCSGMQPVACSALIALACLGLASCGGGPGAVHPDLVVEDPAVSNDRPAAAASLTFSATVRNAGDGPAAATTLNVYRSDDAAITASDLGVGTDTVGELAAAGSTARWVELTAPASAGTSYYGACVDAAPEESNTTNNCSAAVQVTVHEPQTPRQEPRPDLEIVSPWVNPRDPAIGGTFRMHMTLRNAGEQAGGFWIRFYRSDDSTFTPSDPQVYAAWVRERLFHFERGVSVYMDTPSNMGQYYYRACAEEVPRESDTTNNCSAPVKIIVSHNKPNLRIREKGVGNWEGSSFKLYAGVENLGGPSAATTLRFYHSTDETSRRPAPFRCRNWSRRARTRRRRSLASRCTCRGQRPPGRTATTCAWTRCPGNPTRRTTARRSFIPLGDDAPPSGE